MKRSQSRYKMKYIKTELKVEVSLLVEDDFDNSQIGSLLEDTSMLENLSQNGWISPITVLDGKTLDEKIVADYAYFDNDVLTDEV